MSSRPQTPQPSPSSNQTNEQQQQQHHRQSKYSTQNHLLASDPKFKKHTANVERVLNSFENVNEWADFITFLSRLLRTLQAQPTFPVIPHTLIVSKRLAQCLNPALPAGVHQRALDVYAHIFSLIGVEGLRRDFPAWSNGLFPFFGVAATNVRPIVLNIITKYYLPLERSLRPATKALALALLPGLEEVNAESFDKVASLFDSISLSVDPIFFLQTIFLILITNSSARMAALNYLNRRLPKTEPDDSLSPIIGSDTGLLVRGYAATLRDEQILVQRASLDAIISVTPIHSNAFQSELRPENRLLLMSSALSVVLRRDLSLSRRLHTWLLGPETDSDAQIDYIKKWSINEITSSLKQMIWDVDTDSTSRQKPYRILIALLDKWEIGSLLTDSVVVDAFASVYSTMKQNPKDEIISTATMLFDALDPFATWKNLFREIEKSIQKDDIIDDPHTLDLTNFVVTSFSQKDEEIRSLHLPLLYFALIELINDIISNKDVAKFTNRLLAAFQLLQNVFSNIPANLFGSPTTSAPNTDPTTTTTTTTTTGAKSPLETAHDLYSVDTINASNSRIDVSSLGLQLYDYGFAQMLDSVQSLANHLINSSPSQVPDSLVSLYISSLKLLTDLANVRYQPQPESLPTSSKPDLKDPQQWLTNVLDCLNWSIQSEIDSQFSIFAQTCHVIVNVGRSPSYSDILNSKPCIHSLITHTLHYLKRPFVGIYADAVGIFWTIFKFSKDRYVESVLCQLLQSDDLNVKSDTFESFGNLWRLSDDSHKPWITLQQPLLLLLDSLEDKDLHSKQAAEAWMRCSVTSYLRLVDALIGHLLHPSIVRRRNPINYDNNTCIQILEYEALPDQERLQKMLSNLLSIVRFGGQVFTKSSKSTTLKTVTDQWLKGRIEFYLLQDLTYMDGLCQILADFIRSEPIKGGNHSGNDNNVEQEYQLALQENEKILSIVIDILQLLLSRDQIDLSMLKIIEDALISRILLCIKRQQLVLQSKLLRSLHACIASISAITKRRTSHELDSTQGPTVESRESSLHAVGYKPHPLLIRVVIDGLTLPGKSIAVQSWVDFLLLIMPSVQNSVYPFVFPIIDCLTQYIRDTAINLPSPPKLSSSSQTLSSVSSPSPPNKLKTGLTEAEFSSLLNAYERFLLVAVESSSSILTDEEINDINGKQETQESVGFFGYVSNVLGSNEVPTQPTEKLTKTQRIVQDKISTAIHVFIEVWTLCLGVEKDHGHDFQKARSREHSVAYLVFRMKSRIKSAADKIFKAQQVPFMEALVLHWNYARMQSNTEFCKAALLLLDELSSNALSTVRILSESVMNRLQPPLEKPAGLAENPNVNTEMILNFMETYFDTLEKLTAVQVWSSTLAFMREVLLINTSSHGDMMKYLMCFIILAEKIAQTSALHDRRFRRELQELFLRLVENVMTLKKSDSIRQTNESTPGGTPTAEYVTFENELEKRAASPTQSFNSSNEMSILMGERILPNLNNFMIEPDRASPLCGLIIQQYVQPSFKGKNKTLDPDDSVLKILIETSKIASTLKAYRNVIVDVFYDHKFFNSSINVIQRWKPVIKAYMSTDREKFTDLLSRISTTSSVNIFTNRDYEMTSRALSLRRLSYVIFASEKNKYVIQLPSIQEKLVELLRSNVGDRVHREVYLCLRVLLCRVSHVHLSSLWPIILTELLRLFESLMDSFTSDNRDYTLLILSACKFLDLLLVLQTEDFQIHEWMFVTDTTDAVYPPEGEWSPEGIMDRLAESMSRTTAMHGSNSLGSSNYKIWEPRRSDGTGNFKMSSRPMLENVRQADVTSIGTLEPFFERISWMTYENIYSGYEVNYEAVERSIDLDMAEH